MAEPLLEVEGLVKRFGGFTALNRVSLSVKAGERFGLIGPNGSGKTTLINCVSGALPVDGGSIRFEGPRDHRAAAAPADPAGHRAQLPDPQALHEHDRAREPGDPARVRGRRPRAAARARRGRRDPRDIGLGAKAHLRPAGLTQIEMRKLELARAMAARPKLLISDEAMAGLSSTEVDDILAILFRLNTQGITIIMIEHIMRAVMRFSERIVVLDAGERIAEGTPDEVVRNPAVEKAYLGE